MRDLGSPDREWLRASGLQLEERASLNPSRTVGPRYRHMTLIFQEPKPPLSSVVSNRSQDFCKSYAF